MSSEDAFDAARMNFMIEQECQVETMMRRGDRALYRLRWPYREESQREWSRSGREAIDAAMSACQTRTSPHSDIPMQRHHDKPFEQQPDGTIAAVDPSDCAPLTAPLIGVLLDAFANVECLWGLNEPGALVRHRDVFNMLIKAGKECA